MSRGRKGPPQESIDSILLALSRRDDIDPDLFSHYMGRLDAEWAHGAREKVLHLLRSNDVMAQTAALRILTELATDFDLEELEDFVADPTIGDLPKLSLAPILKNLGSEMADDAIVEYLNDPAGAIRQMQMRLLELVGQNEMGVETILEDVVSMPLDRRLAFIQWLGNSNDPRAASLLVPLLESQSGKIVAAVIEALEHLGPIALNQTIPALKRSIASNSNRLIKQQARAVLGRLTMQSMLGADEKIQDPKPPELKVHEARVSSIDGSGTQLIMLSWQRPDGLIKGINVLYLDQKGIKDCYGIDEMESAQWASFVDDLNKQGFSSFHVPFEYARSLVLEARALNKRSRYKLPVAYAIWRPTIEGNAPAKKHSVPATILEPLLLEPSVLELAQHGARLFELKEFSSWLYDSVERIEPYISRYWSAYDPGEPRTRNRTSRQLKVQLQEQQELLTQLTREAISELVDDKWRLLYEARLRRQAALFHCVGRTQDVALMRAVAALLHPDSNVPVYEQAFPSALFRLSIEQGPLRMMVESLRESGAIPANFFLPE